VTNLVPGEYRKVSVATVAGPLTPGTLAAHFLGREAYRHTRYVVVRGTDGAAAVVEVAKASPDALFSPITAVEVLALPHECAYVRAPEVDTGVPSALAAVAAQEAPGARCVAVQGRYEHVNFILAPEPIRIRVADLVPPAPAKLVDQATRVLDVAEHLPPLALVPEVVDLADLARAMPADRYLLPCRTSGFRLDGVAVSFLDDRPARQDWALVGCARSRSLHEWFYGDLPAQVVDVCPRRLFPDDGRPLLTKCCLLEGGNRSDGASVAVPWGASLELVGRALSDLATMAEPAWAPA
jgi:hypothetical protein